MALEPDEMVLIGQCESPWARISLALAFYCDPSSYGVDGRTGARRVGSGDAG